MGFCMGAFNVIRKQEQEEVMVSTVFIYIRLQYTILNSFPKQSNLICVFFLSWISSHITSITSTQGRTRNIPATIIPVGSIMSS